MASSVPRLVVTVVVGAVALIAGGVAISKVRRPTEYVLLLNDVQSIRIGDPVVEDDGVVGTVTAVSTRIDRPQLWFRFNDRDRALTADALVRIRKPVFSAHPEVRITAGCDETAERLEAGARIREASSGAEARLLIRCSAGSFLDELRQRMRVARPAEAVDAFKAWADAVREYVTSGPVTDYAERVTSELRQASADVATRLRALGEHARADSIAAIVDGFMSGSKQYRE